MIAGFKKWLAQARGGKIDWEDLEAHLIQADFGIPLTGLILEKLKEKALSAENITAALHAEVAALWPVAPRSFDAAVEQAHPCVILVLGVNGSGKTTTIAKLAHRYQSRRVYMIAADTFRAAAVRQLEVWAERVGCGIHAGREGGDPAATVFEGLRAASEAGAEVIIVDTAGRLHNNHNLVRELEKVKRVAAQSMEGAPHETLLVVDGTNGVNAVEQARRFHEALKVTGLAVTKLDSSSKGGSIAAIKSELGLDTVFIGNGEGLNDLKIFDPVDYVRVLCTQE
ncbi:MAG: signal recognition particle-docking protein FtsY [Candidatus Methylacidiphilales bacterium]